MAGQWPEHQPADQRARKVQNQVIDVAAAAGRHDLDDLNGRDHQEHTGQVQKQVAHRAAQAGQEKAHGRKGRQIADQVDQRDLWDIAAAVGAQIIPDGIKRLQVDAVMDFLPAKGAVKKQQVEQHPDIVCKQHRQPLAHVPPRGRKDQAPQGDERRSKRQLDRHADRKARVQFDI